MYNYCQIKFVFPTIETVLLYIQGSCSQVVAMFLRQLVWIQPESMSCIFGWMGASSSNTRWRKVLLTRQTKSWNSHSYGSLMVGEENVGNVTLLCFVVALARITLNSVALGRGSHQRAAANQTDAVDCNRLSHLFRVLRPFSKCVLWAPLLLLRWWWPSKPDNEVAHC